MRSFSNRSIRDAIDAWRRDGHAPKQAGIVSGSLIDPATIANAHIRAHGEEGRLFRVVVEEALSACGLDVSVTVEKDLWSKGAKVRKIAEARLKARVTELGRELTGGWRAEDKAAALAAWMLL